MNAKHSFFSKKITFGWNKKEFFIRRYLKILLGIIPTRSPDGYKVFVISCQQKSRQPVAELALNMLISKVKQKKHRISGAPLRYAGCHAYCVPPSSSWQPTLSCKSLYSLHLHYTTGLRCAQHLSFHSGSIPFSHSQSTGCPC